MDDGEYHLDDPKEELYEEELSEKKPSNKNKIIIIISIIVISIIIIAKWIRKNHLYEKIPAMLWFNMTGNIFLSLICKFSLIFTVILFRPSSGQFMQQFCRGNAVVGQQHHAVVP